MYIEGSAHVSIVNTTIHGNQASYVRRSRNFLPRPSQDETSWRLVVAHLLAHLLTLPTCPTTLVGCCHLRCYVGAVIHQFHHLQLQ